jgi:tetratricopeptide (TPR) repeat protein
MRTIIRLIPVLVLSLLVCLPATRASVTGVGAAAFLEVDSLLIVYPSGGSEKDTAAVKAQAEAQAAFLRRSRSVEVEICSDAEWNLEDRERNQLWLGWNNRVFDLAELERPFKREPDGSFEFLGLIADPGEDLLFAFPNPWKTGRILSFWSRTDPFKTRLSVLPVLGSDWAIYDAYLAERQGMFKKIDGWPPTRNSLGQIDHRPMLEARAKLARTIHSAHVQLTYAPETLEDSQARRILAAREAAFLEAADATGAGKDKKLKLYVYATLAEKIEHTGVPDQVHSRPDLGELHMLARLAASRSPHEEIHFHMEHTWGPASLSLFYEGRALEWDDSFNGTPLQAYAAAWLDRGQLPEVASLFRAGGKYFLSAEQGRDLFPAAALFLRWVEESYGEAAAKRAYISPSGGHTAFARSLKMSTAALDKNFHAWLKRYAASESEETRYLRLLSEAEGFLKANDMEGLSGHLALMHERFPDRPESGHNLANVQIRLGRWEEAETLLRKVVEIAQRTGSLRYQLVGLYDLGRVLDYQGKRERAIEAYRAVLALPDQRDMHALAQTAIYAPLTPELGR